MLLNGEIIKNVFFFQNSELAEVLFKGFWTFGLLVASQRSLGRRRHTDHLAVVAKRTLSTTWY